MKKEDRAKIKGYSEKVFSISDIKTLEEDGKIYLTGVANNKDIVDSHGDIPTSFNGEPVYDFTTRFKKNPVCFVDHYASASNIAGTFVKYMEDGTGLRFKLLFRDLDKVFNLDVKDAISAFQTGHGRALSIGGEWLHKDEENRSHLTKAIIYEMSLVGLGSDSQALTDTELPKSVNAKVENKTVTSWSRLPKEIAGRGTAWDSVEAVTRLKAFCDSENAYADTFLLSDDESKKSDFPICDIVDGKIAAVPAAIFSVRAIMAGAMGGTDISDENRKQVEDRLNRYYEAMGLDAPYGEKASWSVVEIKELPRPLLSFVVKNCKLSKTSAEYIAMLVDEKSAATEPGKPVDGEPEKSETKTETNKTVDITSDICNALKDIRANIIKERDNG